MRQFSVSGNSGVLRYILYFAVSALLFPAGVYADTGVDGADGVTTVPAVEVIVPDLTDLPSDQVGDALQASNLTKGTVSREYSTGNLKDGLVIGQEPLAGSVVLAASGVNIVVAVKPDVTVYGSEVRDTALAYALVEGEVSAGASEVKSVAVANDRYVDQFFSGTIDAFGRISSEVPLVPGVNLLTLTVVYDSGLTIGKTVTVTSSIPALPVVVIESPEDGAVVTRSRVTVKGTVISSLPADRIGLHVGGQVYFPVGEGGHYVFEIPDIPLNEGRNDLKVVAETTYGSVAAQIAVNHILEPSGNGPVPPVIEISSPMPGSYISGRVIPVKGAVRGERPIVSVDVNGQPVALIGSGTWVVFETELAAGEGGDSREIHVKAVDSGGEEAELTIAAFVDTTAPVIELTSPGAAPGLIHVKESPVTIKGEVRDTHLAEFTINGEAVNVTPGPGDGTWNFTASLKLPAGREEMAVLEARDYSGNVTGRELEFFYESSMDIHIVSPAENSKVFISSADRGINLLGTIAGLADSHSVYARVDEEAQVRLNLDGESFSGKIVLSGMNKEHRLYVEVRDDTGGVVEKTSIAFATVNVDDIPHEVTRQEPAANEAGVDTNAFISFYFNKAVDPSKLQVEVLETAHGKVYAEQPGGSDITMLSNVRLTDVSREREPVPGGLSNFPENTMTTFYPARDFAYGATVYVTVSYDGEKIWQSTFKVRPMPTLIRGFVLNQFMQPVKGVEVFVPDLNRKAYSDHEGGFTFGFGEDASKDIPGGKYRFLFNSGLLNANHGVIEKRVTLESGRLNNLRVVMIPALNKREPFRRIRSGNKREVLKGGDLILNLEDAQLTFPDGRNGGSVHVQFMGYSRLSHVAREIAVPSWVYAVQPQGIDVAGDVGLEFSLPALHGGYDYLAETDYVILTGFDPSLDMITPVGIGKVDREEHMVRSVGRVNLKSLNYVGYVAYPENVQNILEKIGLGDMDLETFINYAESRL